MSLTNITIPVLNEEKVLAASIHKIVACLNVDFAAAYEIVIVDNGSADRTFEIARQLADQYSNVRVIRLNQRGRGRAIKKIWMESEANILSYMDVDLSTDLEYLPLLIQPLISGSSDVAIGSRLLDPSLTKRGFKREFISRSYNLLVKALFQTSFSDAQCGFKAITRRAADELLPLVEDTGWFFDSELLILAEKRSYRIFDLPVRWVDDPDSRVKIVATALEDIKGLIRVRRNLSANKYPLAKALCFLV